MSYSTIYKVYKTTVIPVAEFQNGHGSAPPIWDWLAQRYLGVDDAWMLKDWKPLWQLRENKAVPVHMRFALLATFDDGVVPLYGLERASKLAKLAYTATYDPQYVNHWDTISETYAKFKHSKDSRIFGLALGCTSVSDPWWELEQRRPFDIIKSLELDND